MLHKYEAPVLAISVELWPGQIVGGVAVTLAVGLLLTVIVAVAEAVHAIGEEYVTVYEVVLAGDAVIEAVVAPVLHKYVPPPTEVDAVKVPLPPGQMVSL